MDTARSYPPSSPSSPASSLFSDTPECALRHTYATRDERLQATTLHQAGLSQREIANQIEISRNKVRYAIQNPPTPRKHSGRPSPFTSEQIDKIEEWIRSSKRNRRTSWEGIPKALNLQYSYYAIRRALRKRGYHRRIVRR
jgi:transposase